MLTISDRSKLKIIKVRPWRINFIYDGLHYSLNDHSDCGESVTRLVCKETDDVLWSDYCSLYINDYIKVGYNDYKKPLVYSHIDIDFFIDKLIEDGIIKIAVIKS